MQPAYQLAHGSKERIHDLDDEELTFGVF
jgi:hypothetical protein